MYMTAVWQYGLYVFVGGSHDNKIKEQVIKGPPAHGTRATRHECTQHTDDRYKESPSHRLPSQSMLFAWILFLESAWADGDTGISCLSPMRGHCHAPVILSGRKTI